MPVSTTEDEPPRAGWKSVIFTIQPKAAAECRTGFRNTPAGLVFKIRRRNRIMADALTQIRTRGRVTPQSEQAHPDQVRNNAGGWSFKAADETRVHRFLTIGP